MPILGWVLGSPKKNSHAPPLFMIQFSVDFLKFQEIFRFFCVTTKKHTTNNGNHDNNHDGHHNGEEEEEKANHLQETNR